MPSLPHSLQEKTDFERGITHTPTISSRSRALAEKAEKRDGSAGSGIFERLYSDANKRRINLEVQKVEAELCELSLLEQPLSSARSAQSLVSAPDNRPSLYEEALERRERRELRERAERERESRMCSGGLGVDARSREMGKDRIKRELVGVLEDQGVSSEGVVRYRSLLGGLESLVDFAAVSSELADMTTEEREVLCDRCTRPREPYNPKPFNPCPKSQIPHPGAGHLLGAGRGRVLLLAMPSLTWSSRSLGGGRGGWTRPRPRRWARWETPPNPKPQYPKPDPHRKLSISRTSISRCMAASLDSPS